MTKTRNCPSCDGIMELAINGESWCCTSCGESFPIKDFEGDVRKKIVDVRHQLLNVSRSLCGGIYSNGDWDVQKTCGCDENGLCAKHAVVRDNLVEAIRSLDFATQKLQTQEDDI
jgi:hypothetical protein